MSKTKSLSYKAISPFKLIKALSVFQIITFSTAMFKVGGKYSDSTLYIFGGMLLLEWLYFIVFSVILRRPNFELETIAFFLSGVSLTLLSVTYPSYVKMQFFAILAGVMMYIIMLLVLKNVEKAKRLKIPAAVLGLGLLMATLVFGREIFGAKNWITIGSVSIQTSELVKISLIFVGAATLEKIQSTKNITAYVLFAMACIGMLFIMKDFGTACIFFFTFLVVAFMRSGDYKTIILLCSAAVLGAIMIISFKPYVAKRFASWTHVWDYIDVSGGYQQTRVLIYMASGGLLGVGLGNGKLKSVAASTSDLVFGVICEEWGLLFGLIILMAIVSIALYAIQNSKSSRSSFYSIAACAVAALFIFQTSLNVFGITDILPLTGVTLPFVSRGGSSMISSWGLLAFIKALDIRTYPQRK